MKNKYPKKLKIKNEEIAPVGSTKISKNKILINIDRSVNKTIAWFVIVVIVLTSAVITCNKPDEFRLRWNP